MSRRPSYTTRASTRASLQPSVQPSVQPSMQPSKRKRTCDSEPRVPPHVFVSCFDEAERMIEVDTTLLRPFNCRLYNMIKNDPPHIDSTGRPFWKVNMTRAMLQTFVRSLEHGELSLAKTVSVTEALTTFEFENVAVGVPASHVTLLEQSRHVQLPRPGAIFEKRAERISQIIHRTSEQCAHAIATWPRLESSLDAGLEGVPILTTCTATRVWVNFCKKPLSASDRTTSTATLAHRWPHWLKATLVSYGMMHSKLVRDSIVTETSRDEGAFTALFNAVQSDMIRWLSSTRCDHTKLSVDKVSRKELAVAELFANEMKNAIIENDSKTSESRERLDYARGCFSMADTQLHESPNPSTIFSGACSDDAGKSTERVQLSKSLGQRGIKIVKWGLDYNLPKSPLLFPPAWKETGASGCCVLLDFSDRR